MSPRNFEQEAEEFWKKLEKEERDRMLQAQEIMDVMNLITAYAGTGTIDLCLTVDEGIKTLKQWRNRALELKDADGAAMLQHVIDFLENCDKHGIIEKEKMIFLEVLDIFIARRDQLLGRDPSAGLGQDSQKTEEED